MLEGICISKLMLPWCSESKREGEASFYFLPFVRRWVILFFNVFCFFSPANWFFKIQKKQRRGTFESFWGRANLCPGKSPSMEITTRWALGSSVDSPRVQNVFGWLISSVTQHLSFQKLLMCSWCLISEWKTYQRPLLKRHENTETNTLSVTVENQYSQLWKSFGWRATRIILGGC